MTRKNVTKNDLTKVSKFSTEHQYAILQMLIEEPEFLKECRETLDVNTFQRVPERQIANFIIELGKKNVNVDYDIIDTYIRGKVSDGIRMEEMLAVMEQVKLTNLSIDAKEFLRRSLADTLVTHAYLHYANEAIEQIKKNGVVKKEQALELWKTFDSKTRFGEVKYERPFSSTDELANVINEARPHPIPTYCPEIDYAIKGGLRRGDVGIILAGSGVAKTSFTTTMTMYLAANGHNVAHIVLEDKQTDIYRKYISSFTSLYDTQITNENGVVMEIIRKNRTKWDGMMDRIRTVSACKGNSAIVSLSLNDIDNELERMVNNGFRPDVIVIDYFDRIKKPSKEQWTSDEIIINGLLELATKYNAALWCPSQGGKEAQSFNGNLDLSTMKGGVWRTYAAQIVIALKPTMEDQTLFNMTVLKARYGYNVQSINFRFDRGLCQYIKDDSILNSIYTVDNDFNTNQYNVANEIINQKR